jgi:hypothetical protein
MDPLNMTDADVITTLEKLRKATEEKLSAAVDKRANLGHELREAQLMLKRLRASDCSVGFIFRVIMELRTAIKQGTAEIEACQVFVAALDKAIDAVKRRDAKTADNSPGMLKHRMGQWIQRNPTAFGLQLTNQRSAVFIDPDALGGCDRECYLQLGRHTNLIVHSPFCTKQPRSEQPRPAPTGDPGAGRPTSGTFNAAQAVRAQRDETPQINTYVPTGGYDYAKSETRMRRAGVIARLNHALSFFLSHPHLGYHSIEEDLRHVLAFVTEGDTTTGGR